MTHRLGRVVADGRSVSQANGIDLTPGAGPYGPVRFVMLNFDNVVLSPGATAVSRSLKGPVGLVRRPAAA
jgi:hypothetical protein